MDRVEATGLVYGASRTMDRAAATCGQVSELMLLDPIYWVVMGVTLVLSLWTSSRVKSTFARFAQVPSRHGLSGAQVAKAILSAHGVHDVTVEPVAGNLTDHYDPSAKTLRLSEGVYQSTSVAALGVAAHEVGHAIQHAERYAALQFRSAIVPLVGIGSNLGIWVMILGLGMGAASGSMTMAWIGLAMFASTAVFTLVTLPVEFDASKRALVTLQSAGILASDELEGARKVLSAAAMTYVAAAAASVLTVLYWAFRILGARANDD